MSESHQLGKVFRLPINDVCAACGKAHKHPIPLDVFTRATKVMTGTPFEKARVGQVSHSPHGYENDLSAMTRLADGMMPNTVKLIKSVLDVFDPTQVDGPLAPDIDPMESQEGDDTLNVDEMRIIEDGLKIVAEAYIDNATQIGGIQGYLELSRARSVMRVGMKIGRMAARGGSFTAIPF